MHAYLSSIAPVHNVVHSDTLPFPFSVRAGMQVWDWLFFKSGTFQPDHTKSAEWNRGAYLVQGPGHCSACHTPKNFAGAVKRRDALEGGYGENWYATSLANDVRDGIGAWTEQDIVDFLRRGANAHATAFGPMAEVVTHSTSHLTDTQLHAIAVYLKDSPPREASAASAPGRDVATHGAGLYLDDCAGCHMAQGEGLAGVFPALKGNGVVQANDAETLVHLILTGESAASTQANPNRFAMPAFDWKLSDQDIADVASYVRSAWGNSAAPVSAGTVKDVRAKVEHIVEQ